MLAAFGDDPSSEPYCQDKEQRSRHRIRHHQTVVTHSGGVHGDDLRVARQFAREKNDGDEDEQRTEHVHVIRNEGEVILLDDLHKRDLVLEEIVHLLRQVKDDSDRQNEHDAKEKRAQKLLDNI